MTRRHTVLLAGTILLLGLVAMPRVAAAQKAGGVMKVYFFDSPASMSIHEEATIAGQGPMMGVFNNLVMYDPDVPQSGLKSIVPDLATSWAWDEARTQLSFKLRQGVKWHDGKPFTARDVKCTWDLLQGQPVNGEKLRVNPRKAWYGNLDEVVAKAIDEVTFRLKRPQPAFIALLASGFSPVYPCHVSPARDAAAGRSAPGRSSSSSSSPTRYIKVARNPDYWKKDRPYLDGIEYQIMKNSSTGMLAFCRRQGRHDLALLPAGADAERHQGAGAAGDLQADGDQRAAQRADQPRGAAVQQARSCGARWR